VPDVPGAGPGRDRHEPNASSPGRSLLLRLSKNDDAPLNGGEARVFTLTDPALLSREDEG
jgi:hypothetical protein